LKFPNVPSIEPSKENPHRRHPDFMYLHLAKNPDQEFAIYLQPLPEMGFDKKQKVWVLALINPGTGMNNKEPIILYYAERRNNGNLPPPMGWKPLCGIEPTPKATLIELELPKKKDVSPLQKAIDAANHDKHKMEEIMFDLDGTFNPKKKAMKNTWTDTHAKHANMPAQKRVPFTNFHIVQPAASKDMRRVRGE